MELPEGQAFTRTGRHVVALSPDGTSLVYGANQQLYLRKMGNPLGGSWIGDRLLLGQASPRGLVEVPAGGGTAKLLVSVDESKSEWAHGPRLIAGGRALRFTLRTGSQGCDDSSIVIHELATGRRTVLVNGGTDARVLSTGHLAYFREATMPFDEHQMMVTGGLRARCSDHRRSRARVAQSPGTTGAHDCASARFYDWRLRVGPVA